ncbi:MAG: S9 family peptidase [Candidatus Aminicenantes bacterium]|nr:S9 family peptidase [Candidatus Aminicenantes bacterium]MBL7082563.1 S9 family peptidase [Candidatus Aminicenantes bacterium]
MRTRVIFVLVVLSIFVFGCAPKEEMPRLIPMEDFFRNPESAGFNLSPDGEHLAFMKPWQNRLNVHVQKIGKEEVARISSATERDIAGFIWANNSRIAYVQDTAGDENFRLYAVNIDGSDFKELTPFEKVRVSIIDELENDDEHMLIDMNKRDARVFDVYRININTGKMQMIAQNPGNVTGWMTDHDGNLRVAITTDGVNTSVLYRNSEKEDFQNLITTTFKETLTPLFFTFDNKNLYVASNIGRDKEAIYEYDVENKKNIKLLYEHPEVDVNYLLKSDKRKIITGVYYYTDKGHYFFFDKNRKQLQESLEKRLPGYEVSVTSASKDETKVLVRTYSDRSLGAYYYFDRDAEDFKKLVDVSPWLNEDELAEMKPISYKSRDGLTIYGYLTLPKGVKSKNLPVIINPHGGPWARDTWGFLPDVQFLANRGYAVLQMNFRTSTGYGRKFWEAGFKQSGLAIQDDITDGVLWLIEQGIADPERVGIYGGSYGGYCTLAGVAFTPDLYACGVDYVGISSWFTILESIPPYWEPMRDMFYEMVGDPEKDKELLEATSPLFHADKIKAPLFVAQGANDPRVNIKESDQIVDALKERGIEVEYMVKDNEGHGFRNEENRFDFYRAMEKFLGKHLGGRVEEKIQK